MEKHPAKPWDWNGLSSNPNITWDIVEKNPDKPWDWGVLSGNPNITWDIVEKNPDMPWDGALSGNPSMLLSRADIDKVQKSAGIIKKQFKTSMSDPNFALCRKRLQAEFDNM